MNHKTPADPATTAPPILDEADIGSGEKAPGHAETEAMIRQIPPLPDSGPEAAGAAKTSPDGGGEKAGSRDVERGGDQVGNGRAEGATPTDGDAAPRQG